MTNYSNDLGLVLSGGGARGAYQVGFLQALAKHHPELDISIITGVSAGAINAAYLASNRMGLREKAESLAQIWSGVTTDQVFKVDTLSAGCGQSRCWPSRDLGKLASEYEAELPRAFRFMTRGLGTQEMHSIISNASFSSAMTMRKRRWIRSTPCCATMIPKKAFYRAGFTNAAKGPVAGARGAARPVAAVAAPKQ